MKLAPWNDIFIKRLINFFGLQCTQPHFCEFSELFESLVLTNGGQSIIPGWKSSSDSSSDIIYVVTRGRWFWRRFRWLTCETSFTKTKRNFVCGYRRMETNSWIYMKTALLGLLEVLVVLRMGGDAPPDPPSVGDVTGIHLTSFSSRKVLGE